VRRADPRRGVAWTGGLRPGRRKRLAIPNGGVRFVELSPGRYYRHRKDPKHIIENFKAFQGEELEIGRLKRRGNRLGAIEFRRFSFDDVQCLGFVVYWGQIGGVGARAGTNLLYGYYCADPGKPLTKETRDVVIQAMGVKDEPVREETFDLRQ
jgi:hypothetical protein